MRTLLKIAVLLLLFNAAQAQDSGKIFTDNNPKLTPAESNWLNNKFKTENFDFNNKYIGFVELLSGGFYGIGKFTLPMKKKNLDSLDLDVFQHKLILLNETEKKASRGYDALLVFVHKKNIGKLERLKREKVIAEARNRYPQIPVDAGVDTSSTLSISNSIFFNELYRTDLNPDTTFDFTGKKVAIFNSYCQYNKLERVSIPDYVKRIKAHLDRYGYSDSEYTYFLTDQQKQESGGYDVIIDYQCKMGPSLNDLIKQLK